MSRSEKPVIGFVILVWNSEKVIGKCLDSIINLRSISPVAVLADNGSTDGSSDILRKYSNDYPDIFSVITYERNMGTTISRNIGLKELMKRDIDYYCILDSDTEVNDDAFIIMIDELRKNEKYGLIGPALASSDGTKQMSARCFPTLPEKILKAVPVKRLQKKGEAMEVQLPPSQNAASYPVDYLMSACWLMKPELLSKVGLLDEKIFYAPEDAEYCIRVWKSGYQAAFCPNAGIIHEWQRLSKKKLISKINWEHIKGLIYMFKKHRYLFTSDNIKGHL